MEILAVAVRVIMADSVQLREQISFASVRSLILGSIVKHVSSYSHLNITVYIHLVLFEVSESKILVDTSTTNVCLKPLMLLVLVKIIILFKRSSSMGSQS